LYHRRVLRVESSGIGWLKEQKETSKVDRKKMGGEHGCSYSFGFEDLFMIYLKLSNILWIWHLR
jgi:hypothetical protein